MKNLPDSVGGTQKTGGENPDRKGKLGRLRTAYMLRGRSVERKERLDKRNACSILVKFAQQNLISP